jgi:DNA-binding FrmR family transcriptional regulator
MKNKQLNNRLSRLKGQLQKLQDDINNQKDCQDVVPQFLAVKGALVASYEQYVKISLDECAKGDREKLKKLISLLVKA